MLNLHLILQKIVPQVLNADYSRINHYIAQVVFMWLDLNLLESYVQIFFSRLQHFSTFGVKLFIKDDNSGHTVRLTEARALGVTKFINKRFDFGHTAGLLKSDLDVQQTHL